MRSPHEGLMVSAEAVTPQKILETGFAFWPSKALLTAVELDVFTMLGSRSMTPAEQPQNELKHNRTPMFETLYSGSDAP